MWNLHPFILFVGWDHCHSWCELLSLLPVSVLSIFQWLHPFLLKLIHECSKQTQNQKANTVKFLRHVFPITVLFCGDTRTSNFFLVNGLCIPQSIYQTGMRTEKHCWNEEMSFFFFKDTCGRIFKRSNCDQGWQMSCHSRRHKIPVLHRSDSTTFSYASLRKLINCFKS